MEWMDREFAEAYLETKNRMEGRSLLNPVTFYLYTNNNRDSPQEIKATKASISGSHFNPDHPTRFTIHGWSSGKDDFINYGVRDAWFTHGDMNMIAETHVAASTALSRVTNGPSGQFSGLSRVASFDMSAF